MKYKKELNNGNIVTLISSIILLISCFLPFARLNWRGDSNYNEVIQQLSDEEGEGFMIFFYVALVGSILIAIFSLIKVNWFCIVLSSIVLLFNGFVGAAIIVGISEHHTTDGIEFGFYLFVVATLLTFIFSIAGAVQNAKAKRNYYISVGANGQAYQQYRPQAPAYQQAPKAAPQYQAPQYGQANPYGQQYAQPQYGQQVAPQYQAPQQAPYQQAPQYGQANPYGQQYAQPQYGQQAAPQYQAPQQPAYQQAMQYGQQEEQTTPIQDSAVQNEENAADSAFVTPSFEAPQFDAQNYEAPEDEEVTLVLDQITGNNSQQ